MVFSCSLCPYRSDRRFHLIKHTFDCHSMEPSFHFICGMQGCQHSFKFGSSFSSFKSHASRKHKNWQAILEVNDAESSISSLSAAISTFDSGDVDLPFLSPVTNEPDSTMVQPSASFVQDNSDLNRSENSADSGVSPASKSAAMFLLTLKERYNLPQTAIDFAVGTIHGIISNVCDSIQVPHACEVEDPFGLLETEYKQNKFYRDVFGLVVSVQLHVLHVQAKIHFI